MPRHAQEVSGGVGSKFKSKACAKGEGALSPALQLDDRTLSDSIIACYPKNDGARASVDRGEFKSV